MWHDTTPALQAVAKDHFTANPGCEAMLATTDGNLFADTHNGEVAARAHVREVRTQLVRVTRAGAVVPLPPPKVN